MEINKELAEQLDEPIEITEKEQQSIDELEAKTRQTFDPVAKSYNDQNRRVTDLQSALGLRSQSHSPQNTRPTWK